MKTGKKVVLFILVFVCMMALGAQSIKEDKGDKVYVYTFSESENSGKNYVLDISVQETKKAANTIGFYGQYAIQKAKTDSDNVWSDYGFGGGFVYRHNVADNLRVGAYVDVSGFEYSGNGYDESYTAVDFLAEVALVVPFSETFKFDMAMLFGLEDRNYGDDEVCSPIFGAAVNVDHSFDEIVSMIAGFRLQSTAESAFSEETAFGMAYKPYLGLAFNF